MPPLRLLTLGSPVLLGADGAPLPLPLGKPFALLVLTALSSTISRQDAAALLWPQKDRESSRHSLRQALTLIRKTLGEDAFARDEPLELSAGVVRADVVELETALRDGRLNDAMLLWRGTFLEGFALPGLLAWGEWVEERRTRVEERFAAALASGADRVRASAPGEAVRLLELATTVRPYEGRYWRALFEATLDGRDEELAAEVLAGMRRAVGESVSRAELAELDRRLAELRCRKHVELPAGEPALEFVGRAAELAEVTARWRAARSGSSRVAILSGPTGIGKTRLAEEALWIAAAQGATIVRVKAAEAERSMRLVLAAEVIRKLLSLPGAAGISAASDRVLRALVPSLDTGPVCIPVSGEIHSVAIADAMADLLGAVAEESHLVLFADDLHWADSDSRALLSRVLRQAREIACLFLITFRSDEAGASLREWERLLVQDYDAVSLRLAPLSPEEVAELLTLTAEVADLALVERLAARLFEVTRGNPLFLAESLRSLREEGVLELQGGRWRAGAEYLPDRLELPETVRAVIQQRLSRLSEGAARVAAQLALAPKEEPMAQLRARTGLPEGAFIRAVEELVEREVVGWTSDERLGFLHDQLREAARRRFRGYLGIVRRVGGSRRVWMAPAVAVLATLVATFLWAHLDSHTARPHFGGGRLFFTSGDSILEADPIASALVPGRPSAWTPRGVAAIQPFRLTTGEVTWYANPMGLVGGPYIVRLTPEGQRVIVRRGRPDVNLGSPSPDGQHLVYRTDNTSTPAYDSEIVISRADGSRPRVIFRAREVTSNPIWSPDGRRIAAYIRGVKDTLTQFSPRGERFGTLVFATVYSMAWCGDSRTLVAKVEEGGRVHLVRVLSDGRRAAAIPGSQAVPGPVTCSPDGSAVVYTSIIDGRPMLVLHDLRLGTRERIAWPDRYPSTAFFWLPDRVAPVPSNVRITGDRTAIVAMGERRNLVAKIRMSDGSEKTSGMQWSSSNPSVASVDPTGRVTGNRPGRTVITATADGWIEDQVTVTVAGIERTDLLLFDDLTSLDTTRWLLVGVPTPTITAGPSGRVLSMRGDGNGLDGLLSREDFALRRGGTLSAEFRFEVNRRDAQRFLLCLIQSEGEDMEREVAGVSQRQNVCFQYPAAQLTRFDAREAMLTVSPSPTRIQLPGALPPREWVQVKLQMLPDGTVSLHVNGARNATSPLRAENDSEARWRVGIFDAAVGTQVLVRNVSLRSGAGDPPQ